MCEQPEMQIEDKNKYLDTEIITVDSIKPSITVDPLFKYYQNRSAESIADELVINGYKIIHYYVVNENNVNADFVKALHEAGVEIWLMTVGNGTYSTSDFPLGWENWKMNLKESINPEGGFTYLSQFNDDYVEWKKKKLVELLSNYQFDGIEMIEPYFPAWEGPNNENYGDIGPNASNAFYAKYGLNMPDFKNQNAENYYTKVPEIYNKWIEFRVNGVNQFLHEIYNGAGGIREQCPNIKVATWSLGIDAGDHSIDLLREYQGLDVPAMINLVQPDMHYIQTHWPDWILNEPNLPPNYVQSYDTFMLEIKDASIDLPVGIQADIGSLQDMIKSRGWFEDFIRYSRLSGYSTYTAYEYHIGGYMYDELPKVIKAERIEKNCVQLSFNKRIKILGNNWNINFKFYQKSQEIYPELINVKVDGNRLLLYFTDQPDSSYVIQLNNIEDTPELWLYTGYEANQIQPDSEITVE